MAICKYSNNEDEWVAPFAADEKDDRSLAPFASTPDARIIEMLELAKVSDQDIVADLGAGDGIVLRLVWKQTRAKRAVGYEINEDLVRLARKNIAEDKCPTTYEIQDSDVMEADLADYSVIFTWLQPWAVDLLGPKLAACIENNGCRVISYQWPIEYLGQKFETTIGRTSNMYLYEQK